MRCSPSPWRVYHRPREPAARAQRRELLKAVTSEAHGTACAAQLHETRTTVVFGAGNADAELMFVGEAPGRQRGPAWACRSSARRASCSTSCSAEIGLERSDVFIANIAQMPAAGQPRPASARDRGLPGLPAPPDRADRADGDLHARELLDQAAARRHHRDLPAARAARRSG